MLFIAVTQMEGLPNLMQVKNLKNINRMKVVTLLKP